MNNNDNNREDIDIDSDDSFEICEPNISSISDSMSIVAIPEPMEDQITNGMSSNNNFATKRMDSYEEPPNYDQIQEQDFLEQKLSNISTNPLSEEKNQSLQKLSDNLLRIEDNVKNCSNNLENILTNNLETYLKELRDENEKLKTELEKNNIFMKQQLKNLHEWQTKSKEVDDDHKRTLNQLKQLSDENQSLKEENSILKNKVTELEGKAGLVEELTLDVKTLRDRCHQMANYEKLDVSSELQTHELTAQLIETQRKMDGMRTEINYLKNQLSESNTKLESVPAMESQLLIFERDFKLEEMAKLASLKEVTELEEEMERLKNRNTQLEDKLEKGEPSLDLQSNISSELPVGKHHRRHRRSGRLGPKSIPVLSVGAVLKGFKQYKTTSNDV